MSAREWLAEHRCPHCARRNQAACPYVVRRRAGGGWRCHGYRSRRADEWRRGPMPREKEEA